MQTTNKVEWVVKKKQTGEEEEEEEKAIHPLRFTWEMYDGADG